MSTAHNGHTTPNVKSQKTCIRVKGDRKPNWLAAFHAPWHTDLLIQRDSIARTVARRHKGCLLSEACDALDDLLNQGHAHLVPEQSSTGERQVAFRPTIAGDRYIRAFLGGRF